MRTVSFARRLAMAVVQGVLAYLVALGFLHLFPRSNGWLLIALGVSLTGALAWRITQARRMDAVLNWLRYPDGQLPADMGSADSELVGLILRERREFKFQLAQSDKRLADFLSALQASPNGVVLMDADQRIEWFNESAASHFGFDPLRDGQQHFTNLVRDPAVTAYLAAGDFSHGVVLAGRAHGLSSVQRISLQLHLYGQGRSLLLSRDITAIEQAEAMRRDFVANVSHEIRTPLTVLGGFVETLQTLRLSADEQVRYLDLMAQQASRMQSLVDDLLTLSKIEGSPRPSGHEWITVASLIRQCVDEGRSLSQLVWGQAQHMEVSVSGEDELAGADAELHSALFNLVGNAVRYTPADKSICVRWAINSQGQGVLSVTDEGMGIAPEHLPRLTERFYRVDRSRSRETGGTGLGLAIVKHVAQRHDAELQIESTPGKGSTFRIVFGAFRVRQRTSQSAALVDQH